MATFTIDGIIKEVKDKELNNGGVMGEIILEEPSKNGVTLFSISAFGEARKTAQKLVGKTVKIEGFVNSRAYQDKLYISISANRFYLKLGEVAQAPTQPAPQQAQPQAAAMDLDAVPF